MTELPNWVWAGLFVGFLVWVTIVFIAIDPLLRKLLHAATGIQLERQRAYAIKIEFVSRTPGLGVAIAWLWDVLLYFLCLLPIFIGLVVAAMRWYATHGR